MYLKNSLVRHGKKEFSYTANWVCEGEKQSADYGIIQISNGYAFVSVGGNDAVIHHGFEQSTIHTSSDYYLVII